VLKVLSAFSAVDTGSLSMLTHLDLSAAFDTVDHLILLRRLQTSYGLGGIVLAWLTSYLSNRTQYVHCSESTLTPLLVFGVPQGSVLGPILFRLDTADLVRLVESFGLQPHLYADETQIYGSCRPGATDHLQLVALLTASPPSPTGCDQIGFSSKKEKRNSCGVHRPAVNTNCQLISLLSVTTCYYYYYYYYYLIPLVVKIPRVKNKR